MVAIVIDLNTGRNLKICPCLQSYSSKLYPVFIYVFSRFMCFTLPELLLSLSTKKEKEKRCTETLQKFKR